MPAKKKPAKKTPAKKTSSQRSVPSYQCPNSGSRYSLTEIIKKMMDDESFAKFIKKLLCKIHSGTSAESQAAAECLDSYFDPDSSELDKLCLSDEEQDKIKAMPACCTDQTTNKAYLLDVPAFITVNYRNRFRAP
jgi:hypothetical protein